MVLCKSLSARLISPTLAETMPVSLVQTGTCGARVCSLDETGWVFFTKFGTKHFSAVHYVEEVVRPTLSRLLTRSATSVTLALSNGCPFQPRFLTALDTVIGHNTPVHSHCLSYICHLSAAHCPLSWAAKNQLRQTTGQLSAFV